MGCLGMPFLKLHGSGIRTRHCGQLRKVAAEALEERIGLDPDIDPEKTPHNIYKTDIRTASELIEYSAEHIRRLNAERKERGERKIRKDAVLMVVFIIKMPIDLIERLDYEEKIRLLDDAYEALSDIVGAWRICSAVYHLDEKSAHLHMFWEPMTEDGRLCAKEVMSLKLATRINKEMPQRLQDKGWDIDECQLYDPEEVRLRYVKKLEDFKADHPGEKLSPEQKKEIFNAAKREVLSEKRKKNGRSSMRYKADIEAEKKELLKQQDDMRLKNSSLRAENKKLASIINEKKRLLDEAAEQKIGSKRTVRGLKRGEKATISIDYGTALQLRSSKLHDKALMERERKLAADEREFDERVTERVREVLPGEREKIEKQKQQLRKKEKEIEKQARELAWKEQEIIRMNAENVRRSEELNTLNQQFKERVEREAKKRLSKVILEKIEKMMGFIRSQILRFVRGENQKKLFQELQEVMIPDSFEYEGGKYRGKTIGYALRMAETQDIKESLHAKGVSYSDIAAEDVIAVREALKNNGDPEHIAEEIAAHILDAHKADR